MVFAKHTQRPLGFDSLCQHNLFFPTWTQPFTWDIINV